MPRTDLSAPVIKIISCSACGARELMELSARDGHELACSACGTPLHELKPRKTTSSDSYAPRQAKPAPRKQPAEPRQRHSMRENHAEDARRFREEHSQGEKSYASKRRKSYKKVKSEARQSKKRKPGWKRMAGKLWDAIEDIID